MNEIDNVPLDSVRINGGTQSRVELNQSTIAEYAETIRQGTDLPPVVMFFDGVNFWLADGFHRYHAHRQAGAIEIAAEIRTGTQRDAVLFSVGANASHGLRRTNEDKRRAVMTMLSDPEWSTWSDREIARQCNVSHPFVAAVRSPVASARQQENRELSVASKFNKVESDSTAAPKQDVAPVPPAHPAPHPVNESTSAVIAAPSPVAPPQLATAEADDDAPDLAAELVAADKEIRRLSQVVDTLSNGADLAKEVADWSLKFDQLSGRNAQLVRTANEAQGQARYANELLAKIRKALGVISNAEILPALSARRTA